ncbi:MAG: DUF4340 domain-containing protein [Dehalococcoidia bacterium]|nr:DUF4340 domain-containing protein [Dehalococcoidia bacterium]MDW8120181.1 DUF4340 domain-containing protein [Chloroflexota bacterium]
MNIRIISLLLVFLVVVAGYFYFAQVQRPPKREPEPPWFYAINMDDMLAITLTQGGQRQRFVQKEGNWWLEEPEPLPVDPSRWAGITLLLSGPQSRRLLAEQVDDPARYGLDKPSLVIQVEASGGRTFEIVLGEKTPDGTAHYAQLKGSPQLFLVDASWGDVLGRLVTDPPYPEWYYRVVPERVVRLLVQQGEAKVAFRKFRGQWAFDDPQDTPIDPPRWQEVTPLLGGPPSLRVLERGVKDFAAYGVDNPQVTVSVEYELPFQTERPRRVITLEIGNLLGDGSGYYARPNRSDTLVFVDKGWVEVFQRLLTEPPKATARAS